MWNQKYNSLIGWAYLVVAALTYSHSYQHIMSTWFGNEATMKDAEDAVFYSVIAGAVWPLYWLTWIPW